MSYMLLHISRQLWAGGSRWPIYPWPVNPIDMAWDAEPNATGYDIGWDSVSHQAGDHSNVDLYPNVMNVGNVTSYTLILAPGTWYLNIRSYIGSTKGNWGTEISDTR